MNNEATWSEGPGSVRQVEFETSVGTYYLQYVPVGGKFSTAIKAGGAMFLEETGTQPMAAFMRELPEGVEEFDEVFGMAIVRAEWVRERFVAVGRGGLEVMTDGFQHWRRLNGG